MMNVVKVKVIKAPEGVFPEYWPDIGKIYDADYIPARRYSQGGKAQNGAFCIITIQGKRIVLRKKEFEIVYPEMVGVGHA